MPLFGKGRNDPEDDSNNSDSQPSYNSYTERLKSIHGFLFDKWNESINDSSTIDTATTDIVAIIKELESDRRYRNVIKAVESLKSARRELRAAMADLGAKNQAGIKRFYETYDSVRDSIYTAISYLDSDS